MKHVILEQYQSKFSPIPDINKLSRPKEGWVRTLRKALGMSVTQLAKLVGVSRPLISQLEKTEIEDRVTLKQLRRVANAVNCDLVYALVPRKAVSEMIKERAREKALRAINEAGIQMQLEAQGLNKQEQEKQLNREIERIVYEMPRDLWDKE